MEVPGLAIPCWRDGTQACPTQVSDQPRSCHSAGPGSSSAMGTTWRPRPCMIPMRWSTCPLRACSAPADTSLWSSVLTAAGQLQAWPCAMRVSLMGPNQGWRAWVGAWAWSLFCHTLPLPLQSLITPSNSALAHLAHCPSLPVPPLKSRSPTPSLQETPAWTHALWPKGILKNLKSKKGPVLREGELLQETR